MSLMQARHSSSGRQRALGELKNHVAVIVIGHTIFDLYQIVKESKGVGASSVWFLCKWLGFLLGLNLIWINFWSGRILVRSDACV